MIAKISPPRAQNRFPGPLNALRDQRDSGRPGAVRAG